jgi:hypothetical protein
MDSTKIASELLKIAKELKAGTKNIAEFSVHADRVYGGGPFENDPDKVIISLISNGKQVVVSAEGFRGDGVFTDCFDACEKIIKKASR